MAKNLLILLGLAAAADIRIHYKILESGASGTSGLGTATLITSNEEIKNIMKMLPLEDSSLLIKGVTQATKNQTNE